VTAGALTARHAGNLTHEGVEGRGRGRRYVCMMMVMKRQHERANGDTQEHRMVVARNGGRGTAGRRQVSRRKSALRREETHLGSLGESMLRGKAILQKHLDLVSLYFETLLLLPHKSRYTL